MFLELYNKMSPVQKRVVFIVIIVVVSIAVACALLFWLIPLLSTKIDDLQSYEIITSLTVIVSIIAIAITLVRDALRYEYTTKHTIDLSAKAKGNKVTFKCLFKNESKNRIYPRNFYLLIDGALPNTAGYYDFDNILHHEEGTLDCELGKKCKADEVLKKYPDINKPEYKDIYHAFYHLKHISPNSVSFIDPGEMFAEDITFKFDSDGVYRAILVGTCRNHDCMCANIQFVVQAKETTKENLINVINGAET
jgi:hypothetical protein